MTKNQNKQIWISYQDDGIEVQGFFILIEETQNYVKIKSDSNNILIIPFHKINKIKERTN